MSPLFLFFLFVILPFKIAFAVPSSEGFSETPQNIDPAKKYLFYLHGAWIETHGLNRRHPHHGAYEYHKIVRTLAERGFTVISEIRSVQVDPKQYAGKVANQVGVLLKKGVPPKNISVIGHSKGGHMSLIVASLLENPKINYVIMAGCGRSGTEFRISYEKFLLHNASRLKGRILSLYDANDREAGTCQEALNRARDLETREIVLHTGKGHGLFYSPHSIWIDQVVQWARNSSRVIS